ncbi:MAG: multifunctional CCA tRNA nucleotidyl transferase/2'3'-cyclic phosphodiesterase/2'nucleotidase/phosphatase, partial [Rhodoferax sp.]
TPYPQSHRLSQALDSALAVATESIAAHAISMGATGPKIGQYIQAARTEAIASGLLPPPPA